MIRYTGTKTLNAKPMTRGAYNAFRSWSMPANEDPQESGYLVEYLDGGRPNHPDFAGYISWSSADVFEKAYRLVDDGTYFARASRMYAAYAQTYGPLFKGEILAWDQLEGGQQAAWIEAAKAA